MGKIGMLYSSLGKEERYDAAVLDCWPYRKAADVVEGIKLDLTNMAGGFPFLHLGKEYKNNEVLYLCGEFSDEGEKCKEIQEELLGTASGFVAKKFVKPKYLEYIRKDFEEFRYDWMLYVVWQKCLGNGDFREKLLSIPDDAVLIEDTTAGGGKPGSVWGCVNEELMGARKAHAEWFASTHPFKTKKARDEAISVEVNKIRNIGVFTGQNNMGKILMICRECLKERKCPPYGRELLNSKKIHINGKVIAF